MTTNQTANIMSVKSSLLNRVLDVLACLRACHAQVLGALTCSCVWRTCVFTSLEH